MSAVKHTPGPWRIGHDCNDDDTRGLASVVDDVGRNVATASVRFNAAMPMHKNETLLQYTARASEAGERYANARLIAAAPELLEALQEAVESPLRTEGSDWWVRVNAAIAKATGGDS